MVDFTASAARARWKTNEPISVCRAGNEAQQETVGQLEVQHPPEVVCCWDRFALVDLHVKLSEGANEKRGGTFW